MYPPSANNSVLRATLEISAIEDGLQIVAINRLDAFGLLPGNSWVLDFTQSLFELEASFDVETLIESIRWNPVYGTQLEFHTIEEVSRP